MRRQILIAGVMLVTLSGAASAQPPSRWSFGGTAGFGQTWDDESSIGKGVLAGGYVDFRLLRHTALELSADFLRHKRGGEHFRAEGQ